MLLEHMENMIKELENMSKYITAIKNNNLMTTDIRVYALRTEIDLLNLELSIISECSKKEK